MATETIDAKPDASSSEVSPAPGEGQQDAGAPSSSEGKDEKPSFAEVVEQQVKALASSAETETEGDKPKEDVVTEPVKGEEELPPFHTHPRWQEMVAKRKELETKVQELEPLATKAKQLQEQLGGVGEETYKRALELATLVEQDPTRALSEMKKVVEALEEQTGESLPKELAERVKTGEIPLDVAQRMAKLEAQVKTGEQRQRMSAQTEQQKAMASVVGSLNTWADVKQKADLEFKPKRDGETDGKWEMVQAMFNQMLQGTQIKSLDEVVKVAEQAYERVNKALARFLPKSRDRKVLTSTGSSVTGIPEPKTLDDVAEIFATGGKV